MIVIASVQPTHAYVIFFFLLCKAAADMLVDPTFRISDMWFAEDRLVSVHRVLFQISKVYSVYLSRA